jgi:hypothetical protein
MSNWKLHRKYPAERTKSMVPNTSKSLEGYFLPPIKRIREGAIPTIIGTNRTVASRTLKSDV